MRKRVCQIAYDPSLLSTRELLLKNAGFEVTSFLGNAAAMAGNTGECDLFILGHAAEVPVREEMARWLKARFPAVPVLALYPRIAAAQQITGADRHAFYDNPGEWLAAIEEELAQR